MVTVLGPKGGSGKTLVSCNLAVTLAEAGQRVVLIDLDLQFGDVGLALGLPPHKSIYDLATSGGELDAEKLSAYLETHESGARILSAPARPDQATAVTTDFLRKLFEIVRDTEDWVIVDTPPGFTPEVIAAIDASTEVTMVGVLDSLSVKNTKLGLETLELMGVPSEKVKLVLNRADSRVGITPEDVHAVTGRRPEVLIPSHRDIPRSVNEARPIARSQPRSDAGRALRALGEQYTHTGERRRQRATSLEEGLMELAQRLTGVSRTAPAEVVRDPFAEVKDRIHRSVISALGPSLFNSDANPATLRGRVEADIASHLDGESGIARTDRERLARELADDILGHGPLERLLMDDTVTEIMVNGPLEVWIERQGRLYETGVRFIDDSHLRRIIVKMVAQAGRRVDESRPMVDARLPDGSRLNAVLPPLSLCGPLLTIRKFPKHRLDANDLVRLGSITSDAAEFLDRCVRARLNVLISGGTGCGKTTMLNIMSGSIPQEDRLVTIEETAELQLHQQHVLRLESRIANAEGEGAVAIRDLVRNSLRMRPDRIIVGEVRGAEALDMLQAMNTGHDGSLCTLHANTPRDSLSRLETLVLMAGYDLPVRAIRQQVSSAIDLLVHLARLRDGSRRVTTICEVQRMESDVIMLQDVFAFNQRDVTADGKVVGQLEPTGLRPSFLEKFEQYGVPLSTDIFAAGSHMTPLAGGLRR